MSIVPKGTWRARPLKGVLGLTSKGAPEAGVEFEFTDGDLAGRRIAWVGYFTEKTEDKSIETLRTCGWRGSDLSDLSSIGTDPTLEVAVVVEHEPYTGKDGKERVAARARWVNHLGGLRLKDHMSQRDAKEFAARMRGKVLAVDRAAGRRVPAAAPPAPQREPVRDEPDDGPPPPQEPPPGFDDDLPF